MSPPTPILTREVVEEILAKKDGCALKDLTQYECEFSGNKIQCFPFMRLFRECKNKQGSSVLFEVTSPATNLLEIPDKELVEFSL